MKMRYINKMTPSDASQLESRGWTFLSNHAHVLVMVARDPHVRVREIASGVGITERAVMRILGELEEAGVISRERQGRRTEYHVHPDRQLRHPLEADHTVRELLSLLVGVEALRNAS